MISHSLARLTDILLAVDAPILKRLNDGVKDRISLEELPSLPEDVRSLYKWRNGTNMLGVKYANEMLLFDRAIFMDLQRSMHYFSTAAGQLDNWSESMFPLFESGAGEFYLIECNEDNENYGMIYFHTIDEEIEGIETIYDSLESLLETIIQCYEQRIYTFDSDNCLVWKRSEKKSLAKKLNPMSKHWNF